MASSEPYSGGPHNRPGYWCREGHRFRESRSRPYHKWNPDSTNIWTRLNTSRLWRTLYCERCGATHEICVKDQNAPEKAPATERTTP